MKKLLVLLLAVIFIAPTVFAAYVSVLPAPGYKEQGTTIANKYGKVAFDQNGNTYRYVLNNATVAAVRGYPAWYVATAGNSYTVKSSYEATTDLEKFAGIWYCDKDGNESIATSTYGWIQIAGITNASVEGTTDIGPDDLLIGAVTGKYLVKGRDALTTLSAVSGEAQLTVPGAYAISTWTGNAATGTPEVFLRGLY